MGNWATGFTCQILFKDFVGVGQRMLWYSKPFLIWCPLTYDAPDEVITYIVLLFKKIQKSDSGVKTWKIQGVTVEQSAYPNSWHCQIKKAHEYFCDLPIPSCVSLYPNMGTPKTPWLIIASWMLTLPSDSRFNSIHSLGSVRVWSKYHTTFPPCFLNKKGMF